MPLMAAMTRMAEANQGIEDSQPVPGPRQLIPMWSLLQLHVMEGSAQFCLGSRGN